MSVLSAVLISVISSIITFQLSVIKFRSEKWWELKVSAYQKVIEALHEAKLFSSLYLEAYELNAEVTDTKAEEIKLKGKRASEEISKTIDVGAFILSGNAVTRLRQYIDDSDEAGNEKEWYEYLSADYDATKTCLDDLIVIAKEDLDKSHGGISLIAYPDVLFMNLRSYFSWCLKKINKKK